MNDNLENVLYLMEGYDHLIIQRYGIQNESYTNTYVMSAKRHDKQNLCWNMQIDKHKRNKGFTNIYCNYNKHLNYEAFYYMCENNRIILQDKNWCPNCNNKSINHYSTTIYKRWTHMITNVNC